MNHLTQLYIALLLLFYVLLSYRVNELFSHQIISDVLTPKLPLQNTLTNILYTSLYIFSFP